MSCALPQLGIVCVLNTIGFDYNADGDELAMNLKIPAKVVAISSIAQTQILNCENVTSAIELQQKLIKLIFIHMKLQDFALPL